MAKKKVATRKPQDTTLRNNRARKRETTALDQRVTELAGRVSSLAVQLAHMASVNIELTRRLDALEPES